MIHHPVIGTDDPTSTAGSALSIAMIVISVCARGLPLIQFIAATVAIVAGVMSIRRMRKSK